MGNSWYGPLPDPSGNAGYAADHPPRVGFFTDTSVCIGCKACEVACKEWNALPADGPHHDQPDLLDLTATSYDNTGALGASTYRHVAFVEQTRPRAAAATVDLGMPLPATDGDATEVRWLMASDVCKHCTHAACLDVCPTGALIRTEHGTVLVQDDVCNGCGYCIPACPYGVIDQRKGSREEGGGGAFKCTMCHDRLGAGLQPACATACPTESIQFGPARRAAGTRGPPGRDPPRAGGARGPPLRPRPRRRGRRRRGVLPAARRARGLRAAAGPGRHDPRPALHVAPRRRGRADRGRDRGRGVPGGRR